jgi:hypothetical protein
MKVFDMDSHLREEYVLDEVYRLEGKFADQSPVQAEQREERPGAVSAQSAAVAEAGRHPFQPLHRL